MIDEKLEEVKIEDMDDGGMGSIMFCGNADRRFGQKIVEAKYVDADGILVFIAVNLDNHGKLYELDFWKADFSSIISYPSPESVEVGPIYI